MVVETVLTEAINIQQTKAATKVSLHPHCNDHERVEIYGGRRTRKADEYDLAAFTVMPQTCFVFASSDGEAGSETNASADV